MSPDQDHSRYVSFWGDVGSTFPSLKGAASTDYYFECERMLHEQFFPQLKDLLLLKTDLWDEAKNTEILRWAAEQGARPVGIDIAPDVVREAWDVLKVHRPGFAVADVRSLPFRSGAFDLIYSMGTIEHFPDYGVAVRELFRVLKPRGTAIIGVPNKLDPFLRPLLVYTLQRLGLYAYGMEKSFTPRALRRLLESAGFRVTARTGILFMPGWLRMLDLLCHTRFPRLAPVTGWLIRPFAWLYRRVPSVRRHGYLIAAVVEKPSGEGMTFVQTDLLRVLEEVLPAHFGGTSADYQVLEEEGEHGILRLLLIVSPKIGPVDEQRIRDLFVDELGRDEGFARAYAEVWRRAGTVQVKRQWPVATKAGKILPFHVIKSEGAVR